MFTKIWERFEAIEECHEFMLAYAAREIPNEQGSQSDGEVREFLNGAVEALGGLAEACATAMLEESLERGGRFPAFLAVLDRDARDTLAAMELVLAQPAISSQLIDNLIASMHLRTLLTDIYLLGEVLRTHRTAEKLATS